MNLEYRLDFVIPKGETGPMGPAGIISIFYADYNNRNTTGDLSLRKNTIVPENLNIFVVNNNRVLIQEEGYYEVILTGRLRKGTNVSSNPSITIKTDTNGVEEEFMSIILEDTNEIYFSQTNILLVTTSKNLILSFFKETNSDASIGNVNLIIKKFPF